MGHVAMSEHVLSVHVHQLKVVYSYSFEWLMHL